MSDHKKAYLYQVLTNSFKLIITIITIFAYSTSQHLFNFYESCQGDSNSEGIGRACDAIAKIYAR